MSGRAPGPAPIVTHVVLLGPMAAGKTTLGRLLAEQLQVAFVDSDEAIFEVTGMTGGEIAATRGVAELHRIEREVVSTALSRSDRSVIAAAASVTDSEEVRDELGRHLSVWVDADPATLSNRRGSGLHRRTISNAQADALNQGRRLGATDIVVGRVDTSASTVEQSVAQALTILSTRLHGAEGSPMTGGSSGVPAREPGPGEENRFVLGVNYWPRRKAMYWWSDFDRSEVEDEFDLIASLGLNSVRLFLLWDDWQPDPGSVDLRRLDDFETVCDAAADRGLGLDVTFFTGHMSGPNWSPRWLLDPSAPPPTPHLRQTISAGKIVTGAYRNMYHDPQAQSAAKRLVRTVVGRFNQHPAIWMWNLGNEPDLFAQPQSADAGRRWIRRMTAMVRELDPVHPVTCGLHVASLVEDNGFRVDQVFSETDVAVMHGYPMYVDWSQDELDTDFVPFLCALVTALTGKPCLAEEWGGCTNPDRDETTVWEWKSYGGNRRTQFMAGESALAQHVEGVLPRLVEGGATGAMLWCFADYAEDLWDRPPCDPGGARHERHFGLVRPDGTLKPHAETIKQFASSRPLVQAPERTVQLDVSADEYYSDPAGHARMLYRQYREL